MAGGGWGFRKSHSKQFSQGLGNVEKEKHIQERALLIGDWRLAGMECGLELIITGYKPTPFNSPLHSITLTRPAGKQKQHGQVKL